MNNSLTQLPQHIFFNFFRCRSGRGYMRSCHAVEAFDSRGGGWWGGGKAKANVVEKARRWFSCYSWGHVPAKALSASRWSSESVLGAGGIVSDGARAAS